MQVKKDCLQQELHILPRLPPPPTLPQKNNVPSPPTSNKRPSERQKKMIKKKINIKKLTNAETLLCYTLIRVLLLPFIVLLHNKHTTLAENCENLILLLIRLE